MRPKSRKPSPARMTAAAPDDEFEALAPCRLVRATAVRCTFIMDIVWQGSSGSFAPFDEDGFLVIREGLTLRDTASVWLEFESKAPTEPDPRYPHVAVEVRLPWRFIEQAEVTAALELVNRMNNANGACSTCLEEGTGQIVVRSRIAYSAWNNAMPEALSTLAGAQEEATLNMLLEVISTADRWLDAATELAARLDMPALPNERLTKPSAAAQPGEQR